MRKAASTICLAMAFSVMAAFFSLSPRRQELTAAGGIESGDGEHPGVAGRTCNVGSGMPGPVVPKRLHRPLGDIGRVGDVHEGAVGQADSFAGRAGTSDGEVPRGSEGDDRT